MAKIRVYELARDLGVESKVLLQKMKELKIEVASHQSTLSPAQVDKVRQSYSSAKPTVVVRRRKKATPTKKEDEKSDSVSSEKEEGSSHAAETAEATSQLEKLFSSKKEKEEKAPESSASNKNEEMPKESVYSADIEVAEASTEEVSAAVEEKVEKTEPSPQEGPSDEDLKDPETDESSGQNSEEKLSSTTSKSSESVDKDTEKQDPPPVRVDKATEGGTTKAEKMGLSKKSDFVSAKIVRRATPEELAISKSKEERKRPKIKRVDSPHQVRPKGSPISPVSRESYSSNKDRSSIKDRSSSTTSAPPPSVEESATINRKRDYKPSSRSSSEEEKVVLKPVVAPSKRRSVSTRELLEAVGRDDELVGSKAAAYEISNKKTVYTPSAARRRKDAKKRKDLKSTQITTPRAAYRVVKMTSQMIVVSELALQMHVKVGELIKKFMNLGLMVTANQNVDFDSASLVAGEYGFEVKKVIRTVEDVLEWDKENSYEQHARPPIVTVMGHVDHGKTTILDAIRKADVANREAGGITQHIAAYTVEKDGFKTAFLDTPGHAAFSAMRERGAQVTDIVVLVVAADDGVMPQTKEAIEHAKKAGVPIVVALNKMDKPNINVDRVYTELSELGIQAEDWGGDIQCVKVSAKNMTGIDDLLEAIHIQYEMLELKARSEGRAKGVVVEAHMEKGRGTIATIMVTEGTLSVGKYIVVGKVYGRVRAMIDHNNKPLREAKPSTPVGIIGLTELPMSGDVMHVVKDEKSAREVIALRLEKEREEELAKQSPATLEELLSRSASNQIPQLPLIVKADTQGSVEAITHAIEALNSKMIKPEIIFRGVGDLSAGDLTMAETSKASIIAFNVKVSKALADQADTSDIPIKMFHVIYDLLDAVKDLMVKRLPPILNELVQGHAEVRNLINVPKIGVIAGSAVTDGKITRNSMLRVMRNGEPVYSGKVSSLKRFKDDVKEVLNGFECGIGVDGYKDLELGDIIESYIIEEKPAVLDI